MAFGQTYDTPEPMSASTLFSDKGNQPLRIDANMGTDPVGNSRMLRHESIHAALGGRSAADFRRLATDPAVAKASAPIREMFQRSGYRGDLDSELPAYLGSFSNDPGEWTSGTTLDQRNAYTSAFGNALGKTDPATADKYRRMAVDSSVGTPAGNVDLYPGYRGTGPPAAGAGPVRRPRTMLK